MLVPLSRVWSWLPDLGDWMTDPDGYLPAHYLEISFFLALQVVLACGLAVAAEELTGRHAAPSLQAWGVWHQVFSHHKPPSATQVWLKIHTEDGAVFRGALRSYTTEGETRDLVLGGNPVWRLTPGGDPDVEAGDWERILPFDAVVISAERILSIQVEYMDQKGNPVQAVPRSAPSRRRGR